MTAYRRSAVLLAAALSAGCFTAASAQDDTALLADPAGQVLAAESAGVVFARIKAPSVLEPHRVADNTPLSCDSKMARLLDNPEARDVLARHIPDVVSSPQIAMARGMTLKQLAGFRQTGITPEQLTEIDQDLASATHR